MMISSRITDTNARTCFFHPTHTHTQNGKTALHMAVESGNFTNVRALLNCNANIEAVDSSQQTSLFVAVKLRKYNIAKLLVGHGANITATDNVSCVA